MVTMRKFHENFLKKKRDNSVWRYPRKKKERKKKRERELNHPKGEDLQKFHNRFFFFPQTSRFLFYPSRFEIDRVKTRKKKKGRRGKKIERGRNETRIQKELRSSYRKYEVEWPSKPSFSLLHSLFPFFLLSFFTFL